LITISAGHVRTGRLRWRVEPPTIDLEVAFHSAPPHKLHANRSIVGVSFSDHATVRLQSHRERLIAEHAVTTGNLTWTASNLAQNSDAVR
jgi:hypothetical protein